MIPDYQTLMRPVLEAAENEPRKISDVVGELSDSLGLSDLERAQLLPSGKQTVIANRVHWARAYLKQAELVESRGRGWFAITDRGRAALASKNTVINNAYLRSFEAFQDFQSRKRATPNDEKGTNTDETSGKLTITPDESLQTAFAALNEALADSLLASARKASPAFFEHLIVELFLAMGYGSTSKNAGRALGQSGDNGVDGVIDQDALGVDQIYLQAKRYSADNTIGPHHIRDFFGALNLRKATKGIFVTTSSFTQQAIQTANDLGSRIVLIDGVELSELMIRYNIGCADKEILHIKDIDENFFED